MTSIEWTPSLQSECEWRSPRRSASGDEGRQAALVAGLDLAPVLAQLGLDVRQAEEAVRAGLVLERAELGGVALERPAVLVDPEVALLAQRPAAVTGDARGAGCCGPRTP